MTAMSTDTRIAIIGAGNVGSALAGRFAAAGYPVEVGVRSDKADIEQPTGTPAEVAGRAAVIFLAVPGTAAVAAVRDLGEVAGKVIVDCTNPLRWDDGPVWAPPAEGSNAAAIAAAAPGALVVKGFNTFGAELHANPALAAGPVDVQLAGDAEARAEVAAIARAAGFEPIDAGPLRNAAVLENLAMLWIHLAMVGGHGRQVGFKLLGR
jgi:predicted dinucleotide-binding enzyme